MVIVVTTPGFLKPTLLPGYCDRVEVAQLGLVAPPAWMGVLRSAVEKRAGPSLPF